MCRLLLCTLLVIINLPLVSEEQVTESQSLDREAFAQQIGNFEQKLSTASLDDLDYLDTLRSVAQNNAWEEEEILIAAHKVAILRRFSRLAEGKVFADKYADRAKELTDKSAYIQFLYNLLSVSDSNEDQVSSEKYQSELLGLSETEDTVVQAWIFLNVSQSQVVYHNYQQALNNLEKALGLFEDLQNNKGTLASLNSIAVIYSRLNQAIKAIDYYEQALKVAEKSGDEFSKSILLFNIGEAYFNLKEYNEAIPYLETALTLSESFEDEIGIAYIRKTLASIELSKGNFDEAYLQISEAIRLFKKLKMSTMALYSSVTMLEVLTKANRLAEADVILKELADPASKRTEPPFLIGYYKYTYQIKKKLGDYEAALTALEEQTNLKEQQFENEKQQSIDELMIKFDSKRKENENRILMQENEINELKLKKQKKENTIWLLSFIFAATAGVIIVVILINQVKNRNRFRRLALRDELTKAPNRRAILERAKTHFERFREDHYSLTIAILDIDNFKQFNDKYGHDIGDEVLKVMAQACHSTLRSQDSYGRYGGEEWLLVMVDAKLHDIQSVFERLSNFLRQANVQGLPNDIVITFSLGAAQAKLEDKDLQAVIKRADEKLYQAKEQGRNQFVV